MVINKKEKKEKEREVYAVGRPSLEKLSKDEQKAFFSTLLSFIVEFYNVLKIRNTENNK